MVDQQRPRRSCLAVPGSSQKMIDKARTLPADQVLGIGRPSLGQRAPAEAPGPTGGALRVECGNSVYPPSFDGVRAWAST